MQRNPNLTIIVPLERLFNSFIKEEYLIEIKKNFNLTILTPFQDKKCENARQCHYKESLIGNFIRTLSLNLDTLNKADQVKSFKTKSLYSFVSFQQFLKMKPILRFKYLRYFIAHPKSAVLFFTFEYLNILHDTVYSVSKFWPSLKRQVLKTKPDLVLILSGGAYSGIENTIISFLNKKKIPSVVVIDNWDNLTSKSIIRENPTGLGVWGNEMLKEASLIHGLKPKITKVIGSSRFNPNEIDTKCPYSNFILFAGSGKPEIDENLIIKEVREVLDQSTFWQETLLVYRPHPANVDFLSGKIFAQKFGNKVVLDVSLESNKQFYGRNNLDSLVSLCKHARFVIAPQSTIIVESLSLGTPVVSWLKNPIEESIIFKYSHFDPILDVALFYICDSAFTFKNILEKISCVNLEIKTNMVANILPNFVDRYIERLCTLINLSYEAGV